MNSPERRYYQGPDRRRVPRGGRRATDTPGRFPNVLVAESYEGARIPCVKYLDRFGFRVDEAADGHEALAKIAATPTHVILVESGLPNGPLSRIVHHVRHELAFTSVPVIVMASDVDAAESIRAEPLVAVLAKPFSLSTMIEEVRRLLRAQASVLAAVPLYTDGFKPNAPA